MQNEPVRIITAIVSAVEAILVAAVAFGVDLSAEQLAGVSAALIAVGGVVSAILTRARVFAPSTVEALLDVPADRVMELLPGESA